MKNLYHKELNQQHFDTIVIGSGLGGLTTATFLAKAKQKVLVLEKHYELGGFTHTFKRKKFEWDVGVHYVGRVHQEDEILRKAFDFISNRKLKWANMGAHYDKAIIEGDEYDFVVGSESQIQKMIAYFPEEENAIKLYYQLIKKVGVSSVLYFSEKTMPRWLSFFIGALMRKDFLKYAKTTTYEVLKSLTNNEKLISVLCAQCGNYGLPPKQSSFAIHAIIADHFLEGGNYPIGGSSQIGETITEEFEKNGGKIALKATVTSILVKNNIAYGVQLENGDQLFAKNIVSNAGFHVTYSALLKNQRTSIAEKLEKITPSVSHFCLYVGLNKSDQALQLPKYNIWHYTSYAFDQTFENYNAYPNSIPSLVYISFPSAKDPNWAETHPDMSTIQVVTSCPYEWVKQWENSSWQKRGEEYEQFKSKMQQILLDKLIEVLPQVQGYIEISELSTPLSTKHFCNYLQGEIYGLSHSPDRMSELGLRSEQEIKRLFLTGQDLVCVGVGSSMFSGIITSMQILKLKAFPLLKQMMFGKY